MIAALLLSTLVVAAPETDVEETPREPNRRVISYKKRVMTDPDYKPSMTNEQIKKALRKAPRYATRVRRVPTRTVNYVEVERPRYRRSYIWPAVTFGIGYGYGYRHRGWGYYGRWGSPYWYGSWSWGSRYYRHRYAHRRYGRSRFHFGFRYRW